MSTSLLYHAFGLPGYKYLNTGYVGGRVIFSITQDPETFRCAACGSRAVHPRGKKARRFKAVPIGRKPVEVYFRVPRVSCEDCGKIRQVKIPFADARRTYTKVFERYVLELCRCTTIQDAARHLNVGWDLVKEIVKENLQRRFARPRLKHLRRIAIDEIAVRKGHRYVTIVLDLDSGAVVFVGDGKGGEALAPFWKRLHRSRAQVEAVAMDMSSAYHLAVSTHLPWATIVFDHFHVVKLLNDKLSWLRRQLYQNAKENERAVLKGSRWLLLKNPEHLDTDRNEHQRLQAALALNQPLATAYYMKEDLRQLWSQPTRGIAEEILDDWIARAEASRIPILQRFADTLDRHREGILAYYDFPISTGPLEGANNKIKTMKRQAYGFRDHEFFKLKILGLHETKYALTG